ncbi:Uncharacterised protein [Shigella flexneri]|nr:Uncharacterised protein [Shigella flexneri]
MLTTKQFITTVSEQIQRINFTFATVPTGAADMIKARSIITVWPNQHTIRFVYIGIDIHHFAVKFDFRVGGIQCRLPGISKPLLQGHKDLVDLFIVVRPVRCGTACAIVTVAAAISIPAR